MLFSQSVVSNSLQSMHCSPPWDFPGKNTGVGLHFLLQGSFPPGDQTQISCMTGRFYTAVPLGKPHCQMLHHPWIPEMTLLSCEWRFCHTLSFKIFIYLFVYIFLAVLGLYCGTQAFSSCREQGLLFLVVGRLHCGGFSWGAQVPGTGFQKLQHMGSVAVAHRF